MNILTRNVISGLLSSSVFFMYGAIGYAAEQSVQQDISESGKSETSSDASENKQAQNAAGLQEYGLDDTTITANRDRLVQHKGKLGLLGVQNVMDTPFNAVTLGQESFKNYSMPGQSLTNILTLDPSVRSSTTNLYNDISIRGFNLSGHSFYINGIPGLLCQENIPTLFADSVTVVSGPGSGLNATPLSEAAGGSVNVISKKAQDKPNASVRLQFSGKSAFEQSMDVGQRFGRDNRYGIRINASNLNGETSTDNEKLTQRNLFINFDQKTSHSSTNLLAGYNYTKQKAGMWSVSFSNNVTSLPSAIDGSKNLKPSWAYNEYNNWIVALNHEQKISEHVSAFFNAGYHHEDWYGYIDGTPTITNNAGDYSLGLTNYPLTLVNKYIGIGLKGDFKLGQVRNNYMLNIDRETQYYALSKNPMFGTYTVTGNLYTDGNWAYLGISAYSARHSSDAYLTGWHVMDTLSFDEDRLLLTLGVHGHRVTQDAFNTTTKAKNSSTNADAICPTFGITYKIAPDLTVYANHSESFGAGKLVGTSYENAGEVLDPAKTKQNELGIKLKRGVLLHTLSAFQINQANTTEETISGKSYLRMNGEQDDNGIEYMVSGPLAKKWQLIGGLMYLNAKQNKTTAGYFDGKPVNGAAQWSGTLAAIYKPEKDVSLLARLNYLSSSTLFTSSSASYSELNVPAYMVLDLGVEWKTKFDKTPVTLSAMCYNVEDKHYWKPRTGQNSLLVGSPRTFMVSAQFDL
jgi:iron complex outermembrane recepter protein